MLERSLQIALMLDRFSESLGRVIANLTLMMMLITVVVVVLRYAFNIGSIFLQESVLYCHAIVLMLGMAYTLKHQAHVRVDIFYNRMPPRLRAWVDIFGTLFFLFPVCLFILISSWPYVLRAWQIWEKSPEVGGIPAVFLLKSLIIIMPILLMIQGISELLKNIEQLFNPTNRQYHSD